MDGYSSASEIEAVLSDSEGRRVTPFATPAPPGHVFTPPPGYAANRQFHMAHGLTTAEARRRSVHASAMERQRRLGAGMEAGATAVMNHIRMIIDLDDGQGILQEGRRTVPKVPDISRAEGKGRAL